MSSFSTAFSDLPVLDKLELRLYFSSGFKNMDSFSTLFDNLPTLTYFNLDI